MPVATKTPIAPGGIKSYYQAKIEAAEILINQKTQNLRRLEAQRNALNARGVCILYNQICGRRGCWRTATSAVAPRMGFQALDWSDAVILK